MDFELTPVQQALADTLETILDRHLGLQRAREVIEADGYDYDLESALREAGYFDLFSAGEDAGPLEAVLAVERTAAALGNVSSIAHMLVLPALDLAARHGAVALAVAGIGHPVRYGAHAGAAVLVGSDHSYLVGVNATAAQPEPSVFGYPLARLALPSGTAAPGSAAPGTDLGPGSGQLAANWWRIGMAAEAVGLMTAALDVAVQYARDRSVFGKPVGSFQALQHRLAECSIAVEGARWLVYEAAALGGHGEAAAAAAAHTTAGLSRLTREVHQIMGAIGLTREHDLHLWTFRMQVLRTEMGGLREHRRRLVTERWVPDLDRVAAAPATAR